MCEAKVISYYNVCCIHSGDCADFKDPATKCNVDGCTWSTDTCTGKETIIKLHSSNLIYHTIFHSCISLNL